MFYLHLLLIAGLYGASCSSVCSSKYNPCQHGGKCRVDRETALGYKCVCATGYEGNYCEDKLNVSASLTFSHMFTLKSFVGQTTATVTSICFLLCCGFLFQTQCAASWWGGPVCVPCSCDVSLNFNSQCNTVTGACTCKVSQ